MADITIDGPRFGLYWGALVIEGIEEKSGTPILLHAPVLPC